MKQFLLGLLITLFMSTATAHPQDNLTPEGLMHYYLQVLNDENLPALQDVYHFPHLKLVAGKLTLIDDQKIPVIDIDGLKKSGWKYSRIKTIKVLSEGDNAALIEMNFSRFDAQDREILNQTTFYNLTKNNGYWQILSIHSMGSLAGVKTK
ncbi:MAG: hypothetical protein EBZ75_06060 [Oxalobacteraceae bacterium]|jgi:hypothetical protein|nr:hypothetical protein [Oxalobacteraceae bacterium]